MSPSHSEDPGVLERDRAPVVLCVDDEVAVLSSLRRSLRGEPYEVVTATSAAQALASLRTRPVHVVIADERMPDMLGSELLAEVRGRWPSIGCVILTGYPGHPVMSRGFRAGVDFLLHKPWDDRDLRKTVRKLLSDSERSRPERGGGDAADPDVDLGGEGGYP